MLPIFGCLFGTKSPGQTRRMTCLGWGLGRGNRNPASQNQHPSPPPQDLHHKALTCTAGLTLLPAYALTALLALQRRVAHRSLFGKQVRPPQSPSDPRSSSVRFRLPLTPPQQTDMSQKYKEVSTKDAAPQVFKLNNSASKWKRRINKSSQVN